MTTYPDAETRLAAWFHERQAPLKCWADPRLPHDWNFTAPIGHFQRGPGDGDTQLTLDTVLLDVDWYAADPDKARTAAEQTRYLARFVLPRFTWQDGVTVSGTSTVTAPFWGPDPSIARRSATYRIILHGMVV